MGKLEQSKHYVTILMPPTPGDMEFYDRWKTIGAVSGPAGFGAQTTVLVLDFHTHVNASLIASMPNLKYVVSPTTAHTHIGLQLNDFGIELVTLKGETGFLKDIRSVSEFTIKLMLELARPKSGGGCLLYGKKLGIIGMGRIGQHVYNLAQGFGMGVFWFDKQCEGKELSDLMSYSDFISLHLSEEPSTREIISKHLISKMKPTAFLINTARGSVIDERALAFALNSGKIAGAAVDVIANPLILNPSVKNLIITEHVAGSAIEDRIRTDAFLVNRLKGLIETQHTSP